MAFYGTNYWLKKGLDLETATHRSEGKVKCVVCSTYFPILGRLTTGVFLCSENCIIENEKVRIAKYRKTKQQGFKCAVCAKPMSKISSVSTMECICSEECLVIRKNNLPKKTTVVSVDYWVKKGFDEATAFEMVSKEQRNRSPRCVEYWMARGSSHEEAQIEVRKLQTGFLKLDNRTTLQRKQTSKFCREYWQTLGYSDDEINHILSKNSNTVSLVAYIKRYGEDEGERRYEDLRQRRKDMYSLPYQIQQHGEEKGLEVWTSRFRQQKPGHSKIADKFFKELYLSLPPRVCGLTAYFKGHNKEFGLRVNDRYCFYDYVMPQIKLCIEFNGSYWHGDPRFFKEDDVSKLGGNSIRMGDVRKRDAEKINAIETHGYTVLVLWYSDGKDYINLMSNAHDFVLTRFNEMKSEI